MDTTLLKTNREHGDLKRIAALAGVGIATVSRVFNEKKVSSKCLVLVLNAQTQLVNERKEALECAKKAAHKALQ